MKDTTLKIDVATRDRLEALARARGLTMRSYVAALVDDAERAERLDTATAIFRRAVSELGIAEAFDQGAEACRKRPPHRRDPPPRNCWSRSDRPSFRDWIRRRAHFSSAYGQTDVGERNGLSWFSGSAGRPGLRFPA